MLSSCFSSDFLHSPIFGLGRCPWPGIRFLSWLPPRPCKERALWPWTLLVVVYVIIFIFNHWSKMEQVCLIQSVKSNWKKERGICCEHSCAGERRNCCDAQLENCVALRFAVRATVNNVLNSWYVIPSFFSSLLWLGPTFCSGHCNHCRHWRMVASVAPLWRRRLDS